MRTLAIIGTSAGCGVTTLAALAFAGLRNAPSGAPLMMGPEHGDLIERAGGDDARALDPQKSVWDAGVRSPASARNVLSSGGVTLVLTAPATPLGSADAQQFISNLAQDDARVLDRVALVRTGVYGRQAESRDLAAMCLAELRVPYDRSLVRGRVMQTGSRGLSRRARTGVTEWQAFAAWALGA